MTRREVIALLGPVALVPSRARAAEFTVTVDGASKGRVWEGVGALSAGASSRNATRFKAPRGSPAARARAAAVIRESIRIPPHLSLSPLR